MPLAPCSISIPSLASGSWVCYTPKCQAACVGLTVARMVAHRGRFHFTPLVATLAAMRPCCAIAPLPVNDACAEVDATSPCAAPQHIQKRAWSGNSVLRCEQIFIVVPHDLRGLRDLEGLCALSFDLRRVPRVLGRVRVLHKLDELRQLVVALAVIQQPLELVALAHAAGKVFIDRAKVIKA